MDERHWWIAGKIQESFHIGGFDNPTLLEDFLCEHDTLCMINEFLNPGGPCRIFFYCDKPESGALTTRQLHIAGSLANLKDINLENVTILYFLRHNVDHEVDATRMEKDVFCGELKGNAIDNLNNLLTELYVPLLRAQRDWGQCSAENQGVFMHNMEKFMQSLAESSSSSHSSKQWMLRQPDSSVGSDFKHHRLAALDQEIIAEYEQLVTEWMSTIEAILTENSDERFLDPNAGPLSELERWKRRQRLLTSITEQLKGKECKSVIGVLITAKSRLLKRWKLIDSGITDAMNETKDKVRYLESMKRHLDQLYSEATPSSIINTAIPGIITSMRQMDSVSRFYARQGFLGVLLTKITNQLVLACKEYLKEVTMTIDDEDLLWEVIEDEIAQKDLHLPSDTQQRLHMQLEARLRHGSRLKSKEIKNLDINDETLFSRLKACLTLQNHYKEAIRNLRDSLGGHLFSRSTSMSSIGPPPSVRSRLGTTGAPVSKQSNRSPQGKRITPVMGEGEGQGISIADEETIMSHMDSFCLRIRQILDVMNTLSQFEKMVTSTTGLPRPRMEDLVVDESHQGKGKTQKQSAEEGQQQQPDPEIPGVPRAMMAPQRNLGAISEDEEETLGQPGEGTKLENETEETEENGKDKSSKEPHNPHADEIYDIVTSHTGLTRSDVELLRKYYPHHRRDEGPSITSIVREHVNKMMGIMTDNVTTKTMLDVESKDKDKFEEHYNAFLVTVQGMEQFLAAYLHAVFARKMKTQEALQLMTKFEPIQQRSGVRVVIAEKFVEIFNWYEGDIDEMQQLYEKHKDEPPKLRNAPPVAGAIYWSRQLLRRIEDPMKVFRENKAVTHLKDFSRVVKIYNRLATALVTFESLWFTHWKSHIDHARNGLKATLFVLHPDTREILVNADEKVLELIHEAKWMTRLGIQIPEVALQVMQQESRFKGYKDHLELCIKDFNDVCNSIPPALQVLFQNHVEKAQQNFQPGLTTLAWNSMNIDAFLHQIHTGTSKLKVLVDQVNEIMKVKVEDTIENIRDMIFFDYKTAFSRSWPPHEFTAVIGDSILAQSQQLYDYLTIIESGIKECANILTGKKGFTIQTVPVTLRALKKWQAKARDTTPKEKWNKPIAKYFGKQKQKSHIDGDNEDHSDNPELPELETTKPEKAQQQTRTQVSKKTSTLSLDQLGSSIVKGDSAEDQMVGELLNHYSDQIYEAILLATTRSLVTLAESSGCEGEVIRAASALSEAPSGHNPNFSARVKSASIKSRAASACSERSRPVSVLSMLSNMTWTTDKTDEITYLQFEVEVKFSIPDITVEPALDSIQTALDTIARGLLLVPKGVQWCGGNNLGETFMGMIQEDEIVNQILGQVTSVVEELEEVVKQHLFHFSLYDFLWKDDMQGNYQDFIRHEPGTKVIQREVERLLKIEQKVLAIPQVLPVGPICLHSDPIKNALHGFAMAWKTQYASVLHEEAKKKLDAAVLYRTNVKQRLEMNVANLDQLNSTLHLLEEVRDMENKVDDIYLPIETMYANLKEFELRLPREEVEEVAQLRDNWQELLELAEEVRHILLKERGGAFEQELDKQVKTFVVEVIQFRNAFDAQGPAVPGIPPSEAVQRLQEFQQRYMIYNAKRKTLDSVSKLFGIVGKPFPELDKTGEELELLGLLYGLFQKFIRFDEIFRDTLWAEVDLEAANREVESYWDECLALPSKLKDWDAYNEMKSAIQQYLDVFPLLHKLNSKEIRNRHWLQVMSVTGSSFQLEGNIFRLCHLLDIGLMKHKVEIEEICRSASRELELEVKLRMTEEEWTEQVLNFEHYKKRGPMYLDKNFTERLLEQLEDAQALLAQMLTSRYIGPLREEAASWAEKLKEVAEVLEIWLEVQDLWQYLEAVFSIAETAKELPQEAKRFTRIDKGWTKMMKRAFDTRNVLQCCYGGEVPKGVVLRHIYEELEICFKSLTGYLDNKRRTFPRFYFVSDPVLLALLSRPNDLESVRPHLRTIFSAVYDVQLEKSALSDSESSLNEFPKESGRKSNTSNTADKSRPPSVTSAFGTSTTPTTKIDKRLTQIHAKKKKVPTATLR